MSGPSKTSYVPLQITFQDSAAFVSAPKLSIRKRPLENNATLRKLQKLPPQKQHEYLKQLTLRPVDSSPKSQAKYMLVAQDVQTLDLTPSFKQSKRQKNAQLIQKQKTFRPHCWRLAKLGQKTVLTSVQTIEGNLLTVKVLNAKTPVHEWPTLQVSPSQLAPVFVHTSTTLDELIVNLKRSQVLKSREVEYALRNIDRAHFCPTNPYNDCAIDIGRKELGVCISSPHIHVWAAELLTDHLPSAQACLDIGSGSGYFTALLQHLAPQAHVTGIECHKELIQTSWTTLNTHYPHLLHNMELIQGMGEQGCPGKTFDVIHVGFMCREIPSALLQQLGPRGRMLVPVWDRKHSSFDKRCLSGYYTCVDKSPDGEIHVNRLFMCSFVPSLEIESETKPSLLSIDIPDSLPNPEDPFPPIKAG